MGDRVTPRSLRRVARDPLGQLVMVENEAHPIILLGWMGVVANHAEDAKDGLESHAAKLDIEREAPEHRELHAAMTDAIKAVEIALDAAVNAAWQYYWLIEHCKCQRCQMRHQAENADMQ